MSSPESPAGARRRVRLALREARLARNLTQAQVAEEMEWSTSKVIRIESGEVTISPNDLRPLLGFLEITEPDRVARLVEDARTSRRRHAWWDEFQVHLTLASRQLIQYEMEATAIRYFTNIMIPGPLQVPSYSRAILVGHHEELDQKVIDARLETRRKRRNELLGRRDFPDIFLLLDESVLKRRIGNARTTSEQLADLLELRRRWPTKFRVRVLPYAAEAPLPVMGPFDILTLPDEPDAHSDGDTGRTTNEVMYRESHLFDEIVEDKANTGDEKAGDRPERAAEKANVARHHRIFQTWWDAALDEAASADLIAASVKELVESDPSIPTDPEVPKRARSRKPV
jgi:transcriptional regulator with XRE-family HTH domain